MADRSRDPTIGCFAASNLSGRPPRQAATTKRNVWRACRGPSDSNGCIPYFDFSVFSTIWGTCFSLKS
jgi:hypothetical protein